MNVAFNSILNSLLDVFLPAECICCANIIHDNRFICPDCLQNFQPVPETLRLFEKKKKFGDKGLVQDFFPLYIFENHTEIQKTIHAIKYNGKYLVGRSMGRMLGQALIKQLGSLTPEAIIPVPLYKYRRFERGFNQSEYIAEGVSDILHIPLQTRWIKRIRNTGTQTHLSLEERQENVRNAFVSPCPQNFEGKHILLIDDVITTGATISECAKIFHKHGATSTIAASLALAE